MNYLLAEKKKKNWLCNSGFFPVVVVIAKLPFEKKKTIENWMKTSVVCQTRIKTTKKNKRKIVNVMIINDVYVFSTYSIFGKYLLPKNEKLNMLNQLWKKKKLYLKIIWIKRFSFFFQCFPMFFIGIDPAGQIDFHSQEIMMIEKENLKQFSFHHYCCDS